MPPARISCPVVSMEIMAGGLAAATACVFTNPLEVVKNRLQLQGELLAKGEYAKTYRSPIHGLVVMARTDGLASLQAGLGPAVLYQLVMNGLRLGTFASMETHGWVKDSSGGVSMARTVVCSAVAGAVGAVVGSPVFLVKTQIQTSSSVGISVGHQHNHGNMIRAFQKVYREGGVRGLWQGVTASIPRISVGSAAQLVTYTYVRDTLDKNTRFRAGSWQNNVMGAALSGFVVAVMINPLDVVSTRLYNQSVQARLYSGYMDCVKKIVMKEGLSAFYKGLFAQYLRIGPHSFLSLIFWHQTRTLIGLREPSLT